MWKQLHKWKNHIIITTKTVNTKYNKGGHAKWHK